MKIRLTGIQGVVIVETEAYLDHRGAFSRLYCERELSAVIGERRIVQINHSRTKTIGAVRGMHYQRPPHAEMKLVRCLKGGVWDVAVDLRANSSTFLQWHAEELSQKNGCTMVIPEGCAHGFQVLAEDSELLYLHTDFYMPEAEGGVSSRDQRLKITWPLPVADISSRDSRHPPIDSNFIGITV